MNQINSFSGEYRFLSNFWPSPLLVQGIVYPTVEHAFQAMKSLDKAERARIAHLEMPGKAKRAGREVTLREDWEQVKVSVMRALVRQKFAAAPLARALVATGDSPLIEGNHWGDRFWGVSGGEGTNWLGRILEDRRARLVGHLGTSQGMSGSYDSLHKRVANAAPRVARQGSWPEWIAPVSLTERLPAPGRPATGFDAGIACALDLIPPHHQRLSSILHAAYTPDAVAEVRASIVNLDANSDTAWWLAACSVCEEGRLDEVQLREQFRWFDAIERHEILRFDAARTALASMLSSFEDRGGIPFALRDGGIQGAYIAGHELAGQYNAELDLHFLGTFQDSLGLEDFAWSGEQDEHGISRSGPVHGSLQFVKCSSQDEYLRASQIARAHLS